MLVKRRCLNTLITKGKQLKLKQLKDKWKIFNEYERVKEKPEKMLSLIFNHKMQAKPPHAQYLHSRLGNIFLKLITVEHLQINGERGT